MQERELIATADVKAFWIFSDGEFRFERLKYEQPFLRVPQKQQLVMFLIHGLCACQQRWQLVA